MAPDVRVDGQRLMGIADRRSLRTAHCRASWPERSALVNAAITPGVAQTFVGQTHMVALMLPGAPANRLAAVEEEVLRRIAERWDAYTEAERGGSFVNLHLVARKP